MSLASSTIGIPKCFSAMLKACQKRCYSSHFEAYYSNYSLPGANLGNSGGSVNPPKLKELTS